MDDKEKVYKELLEQLKEKAAAEGIDMGEKPVPELSMKANVHAEATLLAYHLQHPKINPYQYFGGSKLGCHGCSTLFSSFNRVAEFFGLPQFFTKGCHNKIYLHWPCPSLLSPEQRMRQRSNNSLDIQVRIVYGPGNPRGFFLYPYPYPPKPLPPTAGKGTRLDG